jgi:hypothetical protein
MVISENINQLPRTLDEFIQWEPQDGFNGVARAIRMV